MKLAALTGRLRRATLVVALALCVSACSNWQHLETHERWTLYSKPGAELDAERFARALEPAFRAVEAKLGPFNSRVRIHAWDSSGEPSGAPQLSADGGERIESIPGIGTARVRAYHVNGNGTPFSTSGVFLGTSEVGTVVHELIHARLAESRAKLPLWFEEGLATMWGDGALYDGEWVVDGFACWPARVLRDESISDEELLRVMQLTASQDYSARDNILVHFIGWALVFDLARELPDAGPRAWLAHFRAQTERNTLLAETRARIARSISPETAATWLQRLSDPNPGVRLAAAKGIWKLRNQKALDTLIAAMPAETDKHVRLAIGLNVLIGVGEMRVSRRTGRDLWRKIMPALGELEMDDLPEQAALARLLAGMRGRGGNTQQGLDDLARYWEE